VSDGDVHTKQTNKQANKQKAHCVSHTHNTKADLSPLRLVRKYNKARNTMYEVQVLSGLLCSKLDVVSEYALHFGFVQMLC